MTAENHYDLITYDLGGWKLIFHWPKVIQFIILITNVSFVVVTKYFVCFLQNLDGISDIRDESDRSGMRIVIEA